MDFMVHKEKNLLCVVWLDSGVAKFISNFHNPWDEFHQGIVLRRKVAAQTSLVAVEYNKFMCGTDTCEELRSLYRC